MCKAVSSFASTPDSSSHDDIMALNYFQHHWPFVRGTNGDRWILSQRASGYMYVAPLLDSITQQAITVSITMDAMVLTPHYSDDICINV